MTSKYETYDHAELVAIADTIDSLFSKTFSWGETVLTIGEQPVHALHYLIDMGAKQAYGDTSAAFAAFVGQKKDGTVPKDSWSKADREKAAKEIGWSPINDTSMAERTELAVDYFAKKAADKWARICDGSLSVGTRSRLTSDESRLMEMAEQGLRAWIVKRQSTVAAVIKTRRDNRPELSEASDAAVLKTVVADWLEKHRDKFESDLAAQKAKDAELASEANDFTV